MKIDLKKLIDHARSIGKEKRLEELDQVLEEKPAEIAIILDRSSAYPFQKLRDDKKKVQEYYVTGIYDLGDCEKYPLDVLLNRPQLKGKVLVVSYVLYTLSLNRPKEIKVFSAVKLDELNAQGSGLCYPAVDDKGNQEEIYQAIEKWINSSKKDGLIADCVNKISYSELNPNFMLPLYYTREYVSIRESFEKQKVVRLKDLVEFYVGSNTFRSKDNTGEIIRVVNAVNCVDGFDAQNVALSKWPLHFDSPKVEIRDGDLLLNTGLMNHPSHTKQYCFVVKGPLKEKLYLGGHVLGMRLKSNLVTLEYLYLYFRSDIVRMTLALFKNWGERLDMYQTIANIPVVLPKSDVPMGNDEKQIDTYKKLFEALYGTESEKGEIDRYALVRGMGSREERYDILRDEYRKKVQKLQNDDVSYYIKENKKELNITKDNKAYKASVVLAGSILETFLIDWVSAIEGKDLFKEKYNSDGTQMRLNEAIDYLASYNSKKLNLTWKEKGLAEKIMKLRNSIHPAVYMRERMDIGPRDCSNVCQWLDEILQSRGNFKF